MITEYQFGDGPGLSEEPPEWITEEIAHKIIRAKEDLPRDYVLQTVESELGLAIFVDTKMFDRYTVEEKIAIAIRINRLRDEIRETGCPVWVDKG